MKIQHSKIEFLREYADHLKQLTDQDRYTRFGYHARPESIDRLILAILYDPNQHHIFTYYKDDHIVGFGHLARKSEDWELAVSVEHEYQGVGIADALMSYMIDWGKTHGVAVVHMHCIADNKKIQHLAHKHGLTAVKHNGADVTARAQLPKPTALDYTMDFVQEQQHLVDQMLQLQQQWLANLNPRARRQRNDISNRPSNRLQ